MSERPGVFIHESADVADSAEIGTGSRIWHQAQVMGSARVGRDCILGKGCFIDTGVSIGDRCKIQNGAFLYHGFEVQSGVMVGPGAMLLNDHSPRAINVDGSLKTAADWTLGRGRIGYGAGIGGGAIVLPGISVGQFAMVGAGAVVTHDVPDHGLVYGNPARLLGFVCFCGQRLGQGDPVGRAILFSCAGCGQTVEIPGDIHRAAG